MPKREIGSQDVPWTNVRHHLFLKSSPHLSNTHTRFVCSIVENTFNVQMLMLIWRRKNSLYLEFHALRPTIWFFDIGVGSIRTKSNANETKQHEHPTKRRRRKLIQWSMLIFSRYSHFWRLKATKSLVIICFTPEIEQLRVGWGGGDGISFSIPIQRKFNRNRLPFFFVRRFLLSGFCSTLGIW